MSSPESRYDDDWRDALREDRAREDEAHDAARDADAQRGPLDRPGLSEHEAAMREVDSSGRATDRSRDEAVEAYRDAQVEATRDRAERADPDTARLVEARDHQAAGGRFADADADSTQRLIDSMRAPHAQQGRTRDTAHQAALFQVRDRSGRYVSAITRGRGGRQR